MIVAPLMTPILGIALDAAGNWTYTAVNAQAAIQALGAQSSNPRMVLAMVTIDPRVIKLLSVFVDPHYRSFPTRFFSTVEEARAWVTGGVPA